MMKTKITELFSIRYPILQGGMAWIADGTLAAAVSEGGGLGIISAMNADGDYLRAQIASARAQTDKPFGVNIMLMSPHADEVASIVAQERIPVVTTGAGMPLKYMQMWQEAGICVVPVIASVSMARRVARAGAAEAIAAILALRNDTVPPTVHLEDPDPVCDLDYTPNTAVRTPLSLALSNSLGFGGHNACLAFVKGEGCT